LKYFKTIGSEGGLLALLLITKEYRYPGFFFLTCSSMNKYWSSVLLIFDVVDLDIGHIAHINSGSYRGEAETPKRK
jgi:hypothetical protein